jgi:hypothetical protein
MAVGGLRITSWDAAQAIWMGMSPEPVAGRKTPGPRVPNLENVTR